MRQSTYDKLGLTYDDTRTLAIMLGPNDSTINIVSYFTKGETRVRTMFVQEYADESDGFAVYVDTPNNIDATREAMGLS